MSYSISTLLTRHLHAHVTQRVGPSVQLAQHGRTRWPCSHRVAMAECAVEPTPPAAPVTRMVSWDMISSLLSIHRQAPCVCLGLRLWRCQPHLRRFRTDRIVPISASSE